MNDGLTPRPPRKDKGLPPRTQLLIAGGLLAGTVVAVLAWELIAYALSPAHPLASPTVSSDRVVLTASQLKAMKIEVVKSVPFRTERITDGNIALNDDATTPVYSPLSGKVTRLIAKSGDVVRQGAPLMEVEASEFVQGESDLLVASATLKAATVQLTVAEQNESRQHDLVLSSAGAKKDWQQAQADLASAQSTARAAALALASARIRLHILGRTDAEIEATENAPGTSIQNARTLVLAPISGTVVQRQVGLGQYITSAAGGASSPVFSISNLSNVWLVANLREADVPLVQLGQPVDVHVLAFPDKVFHAHVSWISPTVDPATHRVALHALVDNRNEALKPMMSARFTIGMSELSLGPGVPESAIVYEGSTAHVWVLATDNSLSARGIQTGRTDGALVEVTAGLKAGEKVVTGGNLFIDRVAASDS